MTYNDLQKEVGALGFESEATDATVMLTAANRALRTIFTEREKRRLGELYPVPKVPSFTAPDFRHTGKEDEIFTIRAKSVSFLTSGEGGFIIEDQGGKREFPFAGNLCEHREFIFGNDAKITFIGDYSYTVIGFCAFDELFGPEKKDIPMHSDELTYSLKELFPDYHSPICAPFDASGNPIVGAKISGDTLTLPRDFCGRVRIQYKAAPVILTGSIDQKIILPDGCEHLLALLVASYVWLDEDAEKSQYYAALYRDAMAALKVYSRTCADVGYGSIDGWA